MRLYNRRPNFRMKNLRKIIALFAFIFVVGIYLTIRTVNTSLNKTETPQETVEIQKDTTYLLNAEKKIKTV
jgi:DNA phosphorothioation-dependent restriction protein DptG